MKYFFEDEYIEGIIIKKNSQYTMTVNICGEDYKCYFPLNQRIGNFIWKNIKCLVSVSKSLQRQTAYTIEAVSLNNEIWIGINPKTIEKAIKYLIHKDFSYSLITNPLYVEYGNHIRVKKETYSSFDDSICKQKDGLFIFVYSYIYNQQPNRISLNLENAYKIEESIDSGLEIWNLSLEFDKEGISIHEFKNITDEFL